MTIDPIRPQYVRGQRIEFLSEGRAQTGTIVGLQWQDWADDAVLLVVTGNGRTHRIEQERVVTILAEPTTGE